MHLNQHLNFPLTQIFLDRAQWMSHAPDTLPYAKVVNQWLEADSPLCQRVRDCLGVSGYHTQHMRADIECKHLTSLMTSFRLRNDSKPSRDDNVLRIDRLANVYEQASLRGRLELDRLFTCILGSITLPDLLSTPLKAPAIDLGGLLQRTVDVGFGDEKEIYCEHENQWVPEHLIPHRFSVYRTVQTHNPPDDCDDPTPTFMDVLVTHGHNLEDVLAKAVEVVSSDRDCKDWIHLEYYGNDILIACNLKGELEWIHPLADPEECPSYWRDEYPFKLDDLMKKLMVLENKKGSSRVQENLFAGGLGL